MVSKLKLMSSDHSVHRIGLHLIWCTKFRHPVLTSGVDEIVKLTIGQTCILNGWKVREIEVMPDHVHLFLQILPSDSPSDVVRILKSTTAVAVFYSYPKLKKQKFWGSGLWSRGTYYGSVGEVSQETVIRYIENQKTKK